MRTRQPWDKTGTKQIHCLKLTSKHSAFEVNFCMKSFSPERTTYPCMWTQWRRLQYEKIPQDSSLYQGFSNQFPFDFYFLKHISVHQMVWLVKRLDTLQKTPRAPCGGTITTTITSDQLLCLRNFSYFWCLQFSGRITGSGKTIQRQDLHRSMDFRRFQPSQFWNRWLGLLLSNDEI